MASESQKLYLDLLDYSRIRIKEFLHNYPIYPTQLQFNNEFNGACIVSMYENQRNKKDFPNRKSFFPTINCLSETCSKCWKFYLDPRNNSVKFLDIKLGKEFEKEFMGFLAAKGFISQRADTTIKNSPDIAVLSENGKPACFIEMKYLAAPFVKVHLFVKGRECYEGSTTLDTGKKIIAQRFIVEKDLRKPVYYVYWLDYPCIKGIFFMKSESVYEHIDSVKGIEWSRRERSGDYVKTHNGKLKIAHTEKVYLPLLLMGDFAELLEKMHEAVKNA